MKYLSSGYIMYVSPLDHGKVCFLDTKHNPFINPFVLKLDDGTHLVLTSLRKVVPLQS